MAIVAPFLPYDKLRVISLDFLKQYHPSGEIPIPIEKIVELKLQLDIVPVPGLKDEFDVDAFITNDLTEVRVDRFIQQSRSARYRFSLAHEVAHFIVHQDVFKELKFSTIAEWKHVMTSIPLEEYDWIEWQAYALGGLLLVPQIPLQVLFDESVARARKAGLDLFDIDEHARGTIESSLGRHFDVSRDVISKRMKKDRLWQPPS